MTTHENAALTCDICGRHLDEEKGEVFVTDGGGTYCNDHAATLPPGTEGWFEPGPFHPKPGWVETYHEPRMPYLWLSVTYADGRSRVEVQARNDDAGRRSIDKQAHEWLNRSHVIQVRVTPSERLTTR